MGTLPPGLSRMLTEREISALQAASENPEE